MRKRDIFAVAATAFSMGVVFGFLISPAKNGFGNNTWNTTNTTNNYGGAMVQKVKNKTSK
ncbi:hypothetical protein [Clostridium fungisolvens]|uniref:Uncharacterized protein n=1 Tax=Clostridium fungisolvens TaxID=1604897 RepID=A0A6V8SJR1_9CLOT|nr:hypothetical protein [Clostridium fungisolvens]GFP75133.1 hypothetical protein bsdtw1_01204 [Clostridium fungisolvens]